MCGYPEGASLSTLSAFLSLIRTLGPPWGQSKKALRGRVPREGVAEGVWTGCCTGMAWCRRYGEDQGRPEFQVYCPGGWPQSTRDNQGKVWTELWWSWRAMEGCRTLPVSIIVEETIVTGEAGLGGTSEGA